MLKRSIFKSIGYITVHRKPCADGKEFLGSILETLDLPG